MLLSPVDRNSQQSVIGIEEFYLSQTEDWNPEDSLSEGRGTAREKRGFQHNLFVFTLPQLACRVFPDQKLNLCPVCWECRVLTTGPPGKSSTQVYVLSEQSTDKSGTLCFTVSEPGPQVHSEPAGPRHRAGVLERTGVPGKEALTLEFLLLTTAVLFGH